jgi:hypothetical protein
VLTTACTKGTIPDSGNRCLQHPLRERKDRLVCRPYHPMYGEELREDYLHRYRVHEAILKFPIELSVPIESDIFILPPLYSIVWAPDVIL